MTRRASDQNRARQQAGAHLFPGEELRRIRKTEVRERLFPSVRREVHFADFFLQRESAAQLAEEHRAIVADDVEPAAARRPADRKRRHDHVRARFQRTPQHRNIARPLGRLGQKVKHCAVVPQVEAARRPKLGHVGFVPLYPFRPASQAPPRVLERGSRDVENREVPVSGVEQMIDERGRSRADIDDPGIP